MFNFLVVNEKLKICNKTPEGKNHYIHLSGKTTILLPCINDYLMKICTQENLKFSLANIRVRKYLSPV